MRKVTYLIVTQGEDVQEFHEELRKGTKRGMFILSEKCWNEVTMGKSIETHLIRYDDNKLILKVNPLEALRRFLYYHYVRIKYLIKKGIQWH